MASGSIAVCFGTPFDVALVRMQADSMKPAAQRRNYKGVFDALLTIARTEGPVKLYSGLLPNILRGMAMNVGQLACFDQAKEVFGTYVFKDPKGKSASLPTQLSAALLAGVTATAFSLPFDLLKSRMRKYYIFNALDNICHARAYVRIMYLSVLPLPLRVDRRSCLSYLYQQTSNSTLTYIDSLSVSSPVTVVITEDGSKYKGIPDAFITIYRTEGLLAFWTGFGAYYMRTAPHAMIILMSTQPITDAYKALLLKK
jgi:Mitochondrial carrier protein